MNKTELNRCTHCQRHNWHENTHCSWCARRLPPIRKHDRVMLHVVALVAIVSMIALAWRLV
jgi:DNA-binding helix-hairpin-helix protein with protein kinase domain